MTELREPSAIRVKQCGEDESFQLGASTVLQPLLKVPLELQHCIGCVDFGVNTDGVAGVSGAPPFFKRLEVDVVERIRICQLLHDNLGGIPVVESVDDKLRCVFLAFTGDKYLFTDQVNVE